MSEGNVSLADGGCTTPSGAEVFLFHEVALAPELLDVEILSVLRRAVLTKKLQEDRARIALKDLFAWPIERIPHISLLLEAWRYRHQISAYDAMYVATAHLHHIPLLTADGPLSRTPGMTIAIHNIRIA